MTRHLVLSFRFLAPRFHGRGDEGVPEWPPSPLRVFQAVVAAAARAGTLDATRDALNWLEQRDPPTVIAPEATPSGRGYRLSVPHNSMDLVARKWSRGIEANAAEHRTMKNVRPQRLPEDAVVHYMWPLEGDASFAAALVSATRSVVALGWGVDLVVGNGVVIDVVELGRLSSSAPVWTARLDGHRKLRVPTNGTLDDLIRRHEAFLARTSLAEPTLRPPASLSAFRTVAYGQADQPRTVDVAAFTLMHVQADRLRAFDAARRGMAVAGMLRHAVRMAAERAGWDEARVHATVLGHGDGDEARMLLVPVPSIEPRGPGAEKVGAVRRVVIFSTDTLGRDSAWAARALGGMDLIDEGTGEVQAVLAATTPDDRVLRRYTGESAVWATVSPLVLPGYDDPGGLREKLRKLPRADEQRSLLERLLKRREALVRKAIRQAGLGDQLAFTARIETRETGFFAGVDPASRYAVPRHLTKAPRLHVKLTWPVRVAGPLCIGRGRFSGLGLFATMDA